MYSYGPSHMAGQKQDDQLKHIYSSYVRIWDVALKTCQRRRTIGRSGERGSGISVLAARHDDDDSWTVIHLVVSTGVFHISFRPQKIQPSEWKEENKQTIWTWVSSKRKKGCFVTPWIPRASIDYRWHVFFTKLLQKQLGMLTLVDCVLCPAPIFSCLLLLTLSADCLPLLSVVDCFFPSSFVNSPLCLLWTFLSSSTSGVAADLELKPFVWVLCQNRQRDCLTGAHAHTQHNGHIVSQSPSASLFFSSLLENWPW